MKWNYDACGLYSDYKGHVIINQEHPMLCKYLICKEDKNKELQNITTASTLKEAKQIISNMTNDRKRFNQLG